MIPGSDIHRWSAFSASCTVLSEVNYIYALDWGPCMILLLKVIIEGASGEAHVVHSARSN